MKQRVALLLDGRPLIALDECSWGKGAIRPAMASDTLERLAATIKARRNDAAGKSYTRQLLDGGPLKCSKKLGEEAVETVIAGVHQDDAALTAEAADLLYHLLVLLEVRGVALGDVVAVLEGRMGTSGIAEKASRSG